MEILYTRKELDSSITFFLARCVPCLVARDLLLPSESRPPPKTRCLVREKEGGRIKEGIQMRKSAS